MRKGTKRGSRLFTVVMEFEGTTSVAQLLAPSVEDAVTLWVKGLSDPVVYGLTGRQRARLARGLSVTVTSESALHQEESPRTRAT
jgi:hypothetical protein